MRIAISETGSCNQSAVLWYQVVKRIVDCQARAREGSKGLRAESARAFTGRQNSHSGRGEDFLTGQPDFFTETAVTPERKVEK